MRFAVIYIKILSIFIFGSVLRSLFEVAFLGASKEHHGFGPDSETAFYMWVAFYFILNMLWSIVIIRKPDLKARMAHILLISIATIPLMIYMAIKQF
jgi:hypothetical protein